MKKIVIGFLGAMFILLVSCGSGLAADEMNELGTAGTDTADRLAADAGAPETDAMDMAAADKEAVSTALNLTKTPDVTEGVVGGTQYVTLSKPGRDVFVKGRSGEWMPAEDGMVILPGDEVRTEKGSSVAVILDGGKVGQLELKEGSLFKIIKAETDPVTGDKKTLLDLAVGKILVRAEALAGNSKFEVQTPSATTGVRGTLFEIEVEGKLPPRSAV